MNLARKCEGEPMEPFLYVERLWPRKNRDLGTKVTYVCPFRRGSATLSAKGVKFLRYFSTIFFEPLFKKLFRHRQKVS